MIQSYKGHASGKAEGDGLALKIGTNMFLKSKWILRIYKFGRSGSQTRAFKCTSYSFLLRLKREIALLLKNLA